MASRQRPNKQSIRSRARHSWSEQCPVNRSHKGHTLLVKHRPAHALALGSSDSSLPHRGCGSWYHSLREKVAFDKDAYQFLSSHASLVATVGIRTVVVGLPLCLPRQARASKEAIRRKHEKKDLSFRVKSQGCFQARGICILQCDKQKRISRRHLSPGSKVTVALAQWQAKGWTLKSLVVQDLKWTQDSPKTLKGMIYVYTHLYTVSAFETHQDWRKHESCHNCLP